MTTVGFIGSGQIGSAIARLAIEAGHQVVLSNSRGPETLADTAAELGPRASAATSGEAAAAGDIVVVTVPVKAFPNLPADIIICGTPEMRTDLTDPDTEPVIAPPLIRRSGRYRIDRCAWRASGRHARV